VQDDNPFANEKAVERSTYAGTTARPKLKQTITESPRVREPEIRPMFNEQFDQTRVLGEDVHGPRLNVVLYSLVEVVDLEGHGWMLANTRTLSMCATYDAQRRSSGALRGFIARRPLERSVGVNVSC